MAGTIVLLMTLFIASVILGRVVLQRTEQQTQTDAVAMAAISIAMNEGLERACQHGGHEALRYLAAHNNGNNPIQVNCRTIQQQNGEGGFLRRYDVEITGGLQSGGLPGFPNGDVRTRASSLVNENEFGEQGDFRFPKLVLVLDYSGSMAAGFGGSSRIEALRRAVVDLLDLRLRVEYGLVMFNSGVITEVGIDGDPVQNDIRQAIRRAAGGGTNYVHPMDAARRMLTRTQNSGYHILFISDGYPNEGPGPGLGAARRAWDEDVTIFTLFIGDDSRDAQRILANMSGKPNNPGDPDYAFKANNQNELRETFRNIIAEVLCTVGPLTPQPPASLRPNQVHALLRTPFGDEDRLLFTPNLAGADADGIAAYQYLRDDNRIRLNQTACNRVLDNGERLVVRYGIPKLVQ